MANLSLDRKLVLDKYGKAIWTMRTLPCHAAIWMAGIFLPPHERFWLSAYFGPYKENNDLGSRGTSKTFVFGSMAPVLYGTLFKGSGMLTLSASGFRGGKLLLQDSERMILGQLLSQRLPGNYLRFGISGQRVIKKDPSIWALSFKSNSANSTAPTNNPEQLRGIRSTKAGLDERAFFDEEVPKKIIRPMLNVGQDFRNTATASDKNQLFQYSTIDMTMRPWWAELESAKELARREYEAQKARKAGDWDEFDRLMAEDSNRLQNASFRYSRFDYTDLIIPQIINTRDGQSSYKVSYPIEPGEDEANILRYDRVEEQYLYFTYPVDKDGIEEPLRNGTGDSELWAAENRNTPMASFGGIFTHELVQKASERPVWKPTKAQVEDGVEGYYAPLLYTCGDPCVLGIDVARESDETTFVVIRLGEISGGTFKPFEERRDSDGRTLLGQTSWNHICWAEAHSKLQADEAAKVVRDLYARYNIIHSGDNAGVAMDKRGGGSAVRDALANPKPDVNDGIVDMEFNWDETLKIFDPNDSDYRHYAFRDDTEHFIGSLRLLATQNQDNFDWTYGMRAMMQQGKLLLAYWVPPSRWALEHGLVLPNGDPDRISPEYQKWERGYNGVQKLKYQLLRLQKKVAESGAVRFVMPGNRLKDEGKKDLWAAAIYSFSLLRAHLASEVKEDTPLVNVVPIVMHQSNFSQFF